MTYKYNTDACSGEIEAVSLAEALAIVDAEEGITSTLHEGSWAWVEDKDGNRLYLGPEI